MGFKKGNWHVILTATLGGLLILVVVGNVLYRDFNNLIFLQTIDAYLRLVLASWPAAILLLGLFLLVRHRDAIDHFIRNRMTGVGFDGVKGDVIEGSASDAEMKKKNLTDAAVEEEISADQKPETSVIVEEGVNKPAPNTINRDVYERYQKRVEIEDRMQTILISKFPDIYRPHVKLTLPSGKSIILDGLFTTYGGGLRAVEIKYIAQGGFSTLKYSLRGLRERIEYFGIKKMTAIIIADDLTEEKATEISRSINVSIKKYFFSIKDGEFTEVPIPPKNDRLLI